MKPKVSIIIPTHDFYRSYSYLARCVESIRQQTFKDFEIIVKKTGMGMAHNLNEGIKEAKGEYIKIMFTDDYFADKDALQRLVDAHTGNWSVTGCSHHVRKGIFKYFRNKSWINTPDDYFSRGIITKRHFPKWNDNLIFGNNTIGSPSVLFMKNENLPLWDEHLRWMSDCVYYQELYNRFGPPNLVKDINVVIGLHKNQETNKIPFEEKEKELEYVCNKFDYYNKRNI